MTAGPGLPAHLAELSPSWIGRLEVRVVGFNGYPVGILCFVVRTETVSLDLGARNVAVHDREELARWLRHPYPAFVQDDVVWSMQGPELHLAVDRATPYVLPDWFVSEFAQVV